MKNIIFDNRTLTPSKVVCVGRNYVEHIKELGNEMPENLVLFNKPNSAITDELRYYKKDTRFEGEISFLIEDKKIAGVGFGLDLTHAKIQSYLKEKSLPWERAKAFDGSAVFSEFVRFNGDLEDLSLTLSVNGNVVQEASYELMIYKPDVVLKEILSFMDLEDGDIIMSGTPKGVGTYNNGDRFVGSIYYKDKLLVKKEWIVNYS